MVRLDFWILMVFVGLCVLSFSYSAAGKEVVVGAVDDPELVASEVHM